VTRLSVLLATSTLALACGTNLGITATGEFTGPIALAVTSAADRDLLFIASEGTSDVRALQMCTVPHDSNGNRAKDDTCPSEEDFQFLPAPIRVFPASINVSEHPTRMAGARLCVSDGSATCPAAALVGGAAIVTSSDSRIAILDARYLVAQANHDPVPAGGGVQLFDLEAPAVDVTAVSSVPPQSTEEDHEVPLPAGRVYLILAARGGNPARVVALDLTLGDGGYVNVPVRAGSCDLPDVDPRRVALAHGEPSSLLYVADGAGDGVVEIDPASVVAGGTCATTRISFGGRPVTALAVNPQWKGGPDDGVHQHPLLNPAGTMVAGITADGLLFASTATHRLVPVPPNAFDNPDPSLQPMEPLKVGGQMLDVTFLGPQRLNLGLTGLDNEKHPNGTPVCNDPDPRLAPGPCTQIYTGAIGSIEYFTLVAVATSTDGGAYYVEAENRRFVNDQRYGVNAASQIVPALSISPAPTDIVPMPGDPNTPGRRDDWWVNAGVTRSQSWTVTYHGVIPGLERRGANVTVSPDGSTLTLASTASYLPWTAPPISLRVGDVVSFFAFFDVNGTCPYVHSQASLGFELPIVAIDDTSVTVATSADFKPDPATCTGFGAVGEFHVAADQPWLVLASNEVRGRAATHVPYISLASDHVAAIDRGRFDYPLDYTGKLVSDALAAADIEIAFKVVRSDPVVGLTIPFATVSNQLYTSVRDPATTAGFATQPLVYTSPKVLNLTFVTLTGSNVLLQGDPLNLGAIAGVIAYR
jgi:hypothetical protein